MSRSRSRALVPRTRYLPDAPRSTRPPVQPDEAPVLARMAFEELAGAVGGIGDIHRAVADRAFGASGAGAAPARVLHDAISGGVYGALRHGARLAGVGAEHALRQRPRPPVPISSTPRGALLVGALNGLIGDRLEREGSPLHQPMAVRVDGRAVGLSRPALRAAFPAAGSRLVVFLHGLMETEYGWWLGESGESYGSRLQAELGCTPVYLRYNTGRHVSENGRSLSQLLDDLVAAWPVQVRELALVGHSMGGLVARSACHGAALEGRPWVRYVRHVVTLGSPHMGAPLEQAVHYASAALNRLPETQPFARFLRRRSSGIRDLRHGSLVDEDWRDADPDDLRARACQEIPLLENAVHCFVAATVTHSPRHPLGRLVGDWLVLQPSASGRSRTRRIPFDEEYGLHIGRTHHVALLNHPAVYEQLLRWLS